MKEFIRIGVDLAKNHCLAHAIESEDRGATTRKLGRKAMRKVFLETKPCLVGMEACGSAPLSETKGLGAKTHRDGSRGAPDPANLHQALCQTRQERRGRRGRNRARAMARPGMRFVPVKNVESQATLMLHKTRELLIKQKTMGVNALRSRLSEFGTVVAKGIGRIDALIEKAKDDATLPDSSKAALQVRVQQLEAIGISIAALDQEIARAPAHNPVSRLLAGIPGSAR